jgi:signal transduction histidine kinase
VERADRLEKGLEHLASAKVDLVLLDLSLPDSQGLETIVRVRETAPSVPVVICSGLSDRDTALAAIGKGAQDYVLKGRFEHTMLERVIRYALERRRVQEMKEEFTGKVIHDLRSPLVVSLESVGMILDGFCGDLTKEQREFLGMAHRAMQRLNRMIADLMNISKIELGKMELRRSRIDIVDAAREACSNFRQIAMKKGLELESRLPEAPLWVFADEDKIDQVWMNLVSNAIKYTERGRIEASVSDRGSHVECSVLDTGPGIEEKDMGRLFEKFQRLKTQDHPKVEGTGLGLAITKGIVTAHGGKIWAESRPGGGSKFIFTLPKGEGPVQEPMK